MGSRGGAVHVAVLVLLLLVVFKNGAAPTPPTRCSSGDLAALRGFSAGLDGGVDGWPAAVGNASSSSSDGGDCCAWRGVACDAAGEVVGLVLPNATLRGVVAESLAGLAALRVLNLSSNALRGALPAGLLRLRALQVLDVSVNALEGALAAAAVDLPAIREFNVSYNAFNGSHPVLAGAGRLTSYDVAGNSFAGPVDAAALCGASPGLRTLRLSTNGFSGDFPVGFGQCRSLVELSLDGNAIAGALPDDVFGLTSLQVLSLHTNSLSGSLSPSLRNLSSLVRLDVSFNNFSGDLPDVFDAVPGLQELSATSNLLTGVLPATLSRCSRLRILNLRNNSLAGDIGLDFRALQSLVYLDLGVNRFTGPIPASLPECRAMTALNLGRNNLTGEIPATFAAFTSLSFLSLTGNSFSNVSSALRTLQGLPNLTSLVLTKNFHGGEAMPTDIAGFASIEVLVIANGELHGAIPAWLAGLSKLKVLDLSWNHLAGPIPPWLGELDRLFYLDVSNNSLHGEIPLELARMPALMAGGDGSGEAHVQNFPFFIRPNSSARGRQYNQVSRFPPSLVLARNNLTGGVPAALGGLTRVHVVDLSWNALSGPIPPELSGMSSVESLDVSHNALSGAIPPSLARLSFLSHFDVAYNNLSGEVPVGGQFSTFSRGDFDGNPLLCGIHAARCASRPVAPQAVDGGGGRKDRGANIGVVAAIIVGTVLLLAVAAVATWRAWSRRQEDNARVAADDESGSLESAARSTLVLLFANGDDGERTMTLDDVLKATGNFDESRIVGCGGFGMVYRATLADGREVAVKRLSGDFWQMEREFRAEVETLSRVRHRNLVTLQGYCRVGKDRLLIYPYMENGSLDHWLHERADVEGGALPWPARLSIARGAARGLAHLHATSEPRVLHRDIKSSNILLDARLEPRLADFGLARLVRAHDDTHVTTDLVGTLGYIPPEYGHSSVATYRGDVYSLGVVLLELVTGRRPVDMARPPGGGRDVTSWALRMRREARGDEVVDASVGERRHRDEACRVLDVACACVSDNPKSRPTAQQLVEWLDAIAAATAGD
uniref:non-specific serine/threonine protein kinase n=1 Tax=Oryza meridionalis TaxID=40149 RepID=A0A0E0CDW7_9ORYZ